MFRHVSLLVVTAIAVTFASICIGTGVLVILSTVITTNNTENSWQHFASGGMFNTASPSGTTAFENIFFASPCTGRGDIYSIAGVGDSAIRITSSEDFEASPILAHGGDMIWFSRERNGARHVWSINLNSKRETQITFGRNLDDPVQLSSDDRFLLFRRLTGSSFGRGLLLTMHVVDLEGRRDKVHNVGVAATISPADGTVVYTKDQDSLLSINLAMQDETASPILVRGWPIQFSVDGRYLLLGRQKKDAAANAEREFWIWDTEEEADKYIADGYTAAMFGTLVPKLLVSKGFVQDIHVFDLDNMNETKILPGSRFRTAPRATNDGLGVLMVEFLGSGRPEFRIIGLTANNPELQTIAIIDCIAK